MPFLNRSSLRPELRLPSFIYSIGSTTSGTMMTTKASKRQKDKKARLKMSHVIRKALASDAEVCADILMSWIEKTAWMPKTISEKELCDILRKGFPMREAYVISDPVQGYLSLDPDASHIWGLYIAVPGKGLGKALIDRAKEGRRFLMLNSHAANAAAHRFYQREGFEQVGMPWLGSDGIEEITMEWRRK